MKYNAGSWVNPKLVANGVKVNPVNKIMPIIVIINTGLEALLWRNGIFDVRNICKIKICDHMDSKNQPVWNSDIYIVCKWISVNSLYSNPFVNNGQKIK